MQIGMTLPLMEPDLDRRIFEAWVRAIDEGPYASLCFGERMAFDNPETLTLLGACAAWTSRVRLVTTVIVAQLHDPVMLAKALASADMLSNGRLTVGLGVGGRTEDYLAVGADPATRSHADLARRVAVMKRVWAGERITGTLQPTGPRPVQAGGPQLLAGAQGPRAIRVASSWADGVAGFSFDLDVAAVGEYFAQVRNAWRERNRPPPRLTTSFWFASGEGAREQVQRHLRRYFNWIEPAALEALLPTTGFAGSADELRTLLHRLEDVGTEEVHLIPTSADITQLERVSELIG